MFGLLDLRMNILVTVENGFKHHIEARDKGLRITNQIAVKSLLRPSGEHLVVDLQ